MNNLFFLINLGKRNPKYVPDMYEKKQLVKLKMFIFSHVFENNSSRNLKFILQPMHLTIIVYNKYLSHIAYTFKNVYNLIFFKYISYINNPLLIFY